MFNIGPGEMMLLGILALLLFGPKRLPDIGKAAGEAIAAFRNASRELTSEMNRQLKEENAVHPVIASPSPAADAVEPAEELLPVHEPGAPMPTAGPVEPESAEVVAASTS